VILVDWSILAQIDSYCSAALHSIKVGYFVRELIVYLKDLIPPEKVHIIGKSHKFNFINSIFKIMYLYRMKLNLIISFLQSFITVKLHLKDIRLALILLALPVRSWDFKSWDGLQVIYNKMWD